MKTDIIRFSDDEDYDSDELYDEDDDYCYECGGYGDDYDYDEETGELVSNCDGCIHNHRIRE